MRHEMLKRFTLMNLVTIPIMFGLQYLKMPLIGILMIGFLISELWTTYIFDIPSFMRRSMPIVLNKFIIFRGFVLGFIAFYLYQFIEVMIDSPPVLLLVVVLIVNTCCAIIDTYLTGVKRYR